MLLGKPLFPGISEIDQLFQIFSTLGTPTPKESGKLSKVCRTIHAYFQNWKQQPMSRVFPKIVVAWSSLDTEDSCNGSSEKDHARDGEFTHIFRIWMPVTALPSFHSKCGFKAMGLDTKPMDVMHKNKVAGYVSLLGNFVPIYESLKTKALLM